MDSEDESDTALGDCVALQRGTTYQGTLLGQPGPVLLGLASIQRDGGFRDDSLRTYGGQSAAKLLLGPGDLYVSLKDVTQSGDLLGAVSRVPPTIAAGRLTQDTVRLDLADDAPPRAYIYWLLRTPQYREYCRARAIGTTNLSLSRDDFLSFRVPPPTSVRLRLVELLEAIEAKIELNRHMYRTLESLARAIFRSWFVDFDHVRRKMDSGEVGLPPDLAALFPGDLVASVAGPIPRGWHVKPLDEVADFLNGLALQKYPPSGPDDLPVIKGAELTRGVTAGTSRANRMVPLDYMVRDGDLLFSWSGSLHCVIWSGGEGALNQHLFKVTSDDYPKWFVYQWLHEHLEGFRQIAADKATTMGHIKRGHLSEAMTVIPTSRVLSAAGAVLSPIHARQLATEIESHRLVETRDALLPRLAGGHELARAD